MKRIVYSLIILFSLSQLLLSQGLLLPVTLSKSTVMVGVTSCPHTKVQINTSVCQSTKSQQADQNINHLFLILSGLLSSILFLFKTWWVKPRPIENFFRPPISVVV